MLESILVRAFITADTLVFLPLPSGIVIMIFFFFLLTYLWYIKVDLYKRWANFSFQFSYSVVSDSL